MGKTRALDQLGGSLCEAGIILLSTGNTTGDPTPRANDLEGDGIEWKIIEKALSSSVPICVCRPS